MPAKPVTTHAAGARTLIPLVSIVRADSSTVALEQAAEPRTYSSPVQSPSMPPAHGRWNGGVELPVDAGKAAEASSSVSQRIPQRVGQAVRLPSAVVASSVSDAAAPPALRFPVPALPPRGYEVVLRGRFGAAAAAGVVASAATMPPPGVAPPSTPQPLSRDESAPAPVEGSLTAQVSAAASVLGELAEFYDSAARLLGGEASATPQTPSAGLARALVAGGGALSLSIPAGQLVVDVTAAPFAEVRWRSLQRSGEPDGATGLTQDDLDAVATVFAAAARVFRFGGEAILRAGSPIARVEAASLDLRAARLVPEHSLLRRSASSIESAFDRLQEGDGGDAPAEWWARHAGPSMPLPTFFSAPLSCSDSIAAGEVGCGPASLVAGLLSAASARVVRARDALAAAREEEAKATVSSGRVMP